MKPTSYGRQIDTLQWGAGGREEMSALVVELRVKLREWRTVRLWPERLQLYDINGDFVQVDGLGYRSPEVHSLLMAVGAAYNLDTIRDDPVRGDFKEFKTGRRRPWAEDRVM